METKNHCLFCQCVFQSIFNVFIIDLLY
jgi:hypothetical protein